MVGEGAAFRTIKPSVERIASKTYSERVEYLKSLSVDEQKNAFEQACSRIEEIIAPDGKRPIVIPQTAAWTAAGKLSQEDSHMEDIEFYKANSAIGLLRTVQLLNDINPQLAQLLLNPKEPKLRHAMQQINPEYAQVVCTQFACHQEESPIVKVAREWDASKMHDYAVYLVGGMDNPLFKEIENPRMYMELQFGFIKYWTSEQGLKEFPPKTALWQFSPK